MRSLRTIGVGLALAALAGTFVMLGRPAGPPDEPRAALSPVDALAGEDVDGFARVLEPRPFVFPEDHGPHPEYRTEWWYLTGHLEGADGEELGFQVTFFRNALTPSRDRAEDGEGTEVPPSEWSSDQVYMAHFAVTDVGGGEHYAFERLGREAVGVAGAEVRPFRVWLDHWRMESEEEDSLFPMRVQVAEEEVELDLRVVSAKPPVLQGNEGLSQKGREPGNASYYYSFTRLPMEGTIRLGEHTLPVRGEGWMDREWGTSALEPEHQGWDWFSVQLADGRELMYFELRREDGLSDPHDYGVLVDVDGGYRTFEGDQAELTVLNWWRSPVDGSRYPSGWRLEVREAGLDLELEPRLRNQEMDLSFRYWEGAVSVRGRGPEGTVEGRGYVELTGYGGGEAARGTAP